MLEALYTVGIAGILASRSNVTILLPLDTALFAIGSVFNVITLEKAGEIIGYHVLVGNVTYNNVNLSGGPRRTRLADTLTDVNSFNVTLISSKVDLRSSFPLEGARK